MIHLVCVILGVLLGLHIGYRTVSIVTLSTDESYSNKTRVLMCLLGFIVMSVLTAWLFITALTIMFGI